MNTRRKFTILTLLFVLMTAIACQKTDLPGPDADRSDKEARSALIDPTTAPDTTSVPGNASKPGEKEEQIIPPSDTTSRPAPTQKPAPVSLAGEKFLVRAAAPDSLNGKGVFLFISSERNLGCIGANYTSYGIKEQEDTGFEIRIGDLIFVDKCDQPDSPATAATLIHPLKESETMFSLHIGTKKYQGKITRSNGRLLIEWPDESQFKFSDKVVNP